MGTLRAERRQAGQQRPRFPGACNDFIFRLTEFHILLPNAQHTNGLSGSQKWNSSCIHNFPSLHVPIVS